MASSATGSLHPEDLSRLRKANSRPFSGLPTPTLALLSIKPQYAEAIFQGQKRFEFRRTKFKRVVDVVVVYTSSPVRMVVGEFDVRDVISDELWRLWKRTHHTAGIDSERFFAYFRGRSIGHAIAIGDVRRYAEPRALEESYGVKAPQSFTYL